MSVTPPSSSSQDRIADDEKDILQLIDNLFIKACLLVCSRELSPSKTLRDHLKLDDTWFESKQHIQDYDLPPIINNWLHFDGKKALPPLVIETYLDLRELPETYLLRLMDNDGNLWSVSKGTKKREIVLERWLLELDNTSATFKSYNTEIIHEDNTQGLSNQIILLLRYLHTLIQLLPVNALIRSLEENSNQDLKEETDLNKEQYQKFLSVGTRLLDGSKTILSKGRIGLSKPIISSYSNIINETNIPAHLDQKKITPVWTKFGLLRISVSYRRECKFEIQNINASRTEVNITTSHDNSSNSNIPEPIEAKPANALRQATLGSVSAASRKSSSISPSSRSGTGVSVSPFGYQLQQHSFPRKSMGITRQIQPFKVGSVNSVANERSNSQVESRNASTSSVLPSVSARRSSIGSNIAVNNIHIPAQSANVLSSSSRQQQQQLNENGSIESGSKYISSFSNIRRHSGTQRNSDNMHSIDKALRSSNDGSRRSSSNLLKQRTRSDSRSIDRKIESSSNDDLLDFVKMIDEKPEIKIKKPNNQNGIYSNIPDSILRFQNLKPSNEILSEDLSMSYTLDANAQQRNQDMLNEPSSNNTRRHSISSHSHSPMYSLSPDSHSNSSRNQLFSTSALNSRKNSIDKSKMSYLPPIYGGSSVSYNDTEHTMGGQPSSREHEVEPRARHTLLRPDDSHGTMGSNERENSHWRVSTSPRSIDSATSPLHLSRNQLPYKHPNRYSQPTLVSVAAHAKLHRPNIHSTEILEDEGKKLNNSPASTKSNDSKLSPYKQDTNGNKTTNGNSNNNDDDDLMFFMSDMNV